MERTGRPLTAFLGFTLLLLANVPAVAQMVPSLGPAEPFAVLGATTITNVGPTIINGDLGLTPGTAVTGIPPGTVNGATHINNVAATSAKTSAQTAYTDLAARPCDTVRGAGADLAGLTLTPGVHCFSSSALLTGTLTLNAGGNPGAVFIFNVASTLTIANNASVVITGGTPSTPCNTFWQVGSSATLGTNSSFTGNILALTSITLNTGATLDGRALALNGAVTLDTNTVSLGDCAASAPGAPTGVSGTPGNEQVSVSFTPPASNGGSAITGYTVTASPDGATATGGASPIVVTGLTNGTAYTFTVTATNAAGTGPASTASAGVTPSTTPGAPAITGITPGDGQLSVAFTAGETGGSVLTNYEYSIDDGANFVTRAPVSVASPLVIAGLTNGTTYTVRLRAVNANGPGTASDASTGTPSTAPSPPAFNKSFAPATIASGGSSRLTFTIDNTGNAVAATALTFTDTLPAGVTLAATPNAATSCTGGTLTATAGSGSVSYSGGSVAAGASCTVAADVTSTTTGAHVNTSGALTSSLGNSGTATDTLNVSQTTVGIESATGTGTVVVGITGPAGCSISSASGITAEAAAGAAPDGVDLPHGLVDLTIAGCTPGATVDFTVTFPSPLPADSEYWKYGPTSGDTSPHWYVLSSASISGATVTYSITDGDEGDDDLAANGTIEDPAGPGVTATPVPTVPGIVLTALTLLLIGAGSLVLRRRILVPQAGP